MGCGCKGTRKGIPNRKSELWLVKQIHQEYTSTIGDKDLQDFTSDDIGRVLDWYYQIYTNSISVDYQVAYRELIKVFDYHKL